MGKLIPPEIVREIYDRADIVEVIGHYLPLKRKGSNYWALSPFKKEKTPSFAVSPTKQIFKDFSSGKGGNVVAFLMEMEGFTYYEALKWLADFYNIKIPESADQEEELKKLSRKESLYVLMNFAVKFYRQKLHENKFALEYLKNRGLSEETLNKFKVGYAPKEKDAFVKHAQFHKYGRDLLLDSGLAVVREDDPLKIRDKFSHRVMFPMRNQSGKVVSFSGRTLYNSDNVPKYMNTANTLLFNKSQELYGFYQNKENIRRDKIAYLVEGHVDVLALYEAGFKYAVATSGTAFTELHANKLRRFVDTIYIMYDSDTAGQNATLKAMATAFKSGIYDIKIVMFPEGEDPASVFLKYGKEGLQNLINNPLEITDFLLKFFGGLQKITKAPGTLRKFIENIAQILANIEDSLFRDILVEKFSEILKVEKLEIHKLVVKFIQQEQKREYQLQKQLKQREPQTYEFNLEQELLRTLLINFHYEDFQEAKQSILSEVSFTNERIKKVVDIIKNSQEEDPVEILLTNEDENIRNYVSALMIFPGEISENWETSSQEDKSREISINRIFMLYNIYLLEQEIEKTEHELKTLSGEELLQKLEYFSNLKAEQLNLLKALNLKFYNLGKKRDIKINH